jgi:hypothetical protein
MTPIYPQLLEASTGKENGEGAYRKAYKSKGSSVIWFQEALKLLANPQISRIVQSKHR